MVSAWESLHFAVQELVRAAPIKQRLVCAYRRHLATIAVERLPAEVRGSFSRIMQSLSAVPPLRGEDAVAASVRKMSNQEADDCSAAILEVFGITCRVMLNCARADATVVELHGSERDTVEFEDAGVIVNH